MSDVVVQMSRRSGGGGGGSYLERVAGSFVASLAGVALQIGSQYLLFKFEDVKHQKALALADARREVKSVASVDESNDGKLVHFVGDVRLTGSEESAVDSEFECTRPTITAGTGTATTALVPHTGGASGGSGGSAGGSGGTAATGNDYLMITRQVDMFQWTETVKESRGQERRHRDGSVEREVRREYNYRKQWKSGRPEDSTHFHSPDGHDNPVSLDFQTESATASPDAVTVGPGFRVTQLAWLLAALNKVPLPRDCAVKTAGSGTALMKKGEHWYFAARDNAAPPTPEHQSGGGGGGGGGGAQVGDHRVRFMVIKAGQKVSVIGRQQPDGTILSDGTSHVVAGDVTADQMLTEAEDQVKVMGTLVHVGAAAASFVAYRLVLQPLVTIPGFVPGLEGMLGLGANAVALPSALATTALTILAGWISARMPYPFLKTAVHLIYLVLVWTSVSGAVGFASRRTMAAGQLAAGQAVSLNRWLLGQLRSLTGTS
jgi:hypothetical protein